MIWLLQKAAIIMLMFYCVNSHTTYTQGYYEVTKDWIITVNASSVIGVYNTSRSSHCTWMCIREADCFAVNVLPVEGSTVGYTCELLPAVVSVYNFQHSPGAWYYRKPCCSIPEAAGQIFNEKGDVQYAFFELWETFTEAIASCNSYGMKLVALETEEEYSMVLSALTGREGAIWLAAYEVGDTDTFTWINHDALLSYHRWDTDQLNDNQSHCIAVNSNLWMLQRSCSEYRHYICECPYVR